VRYENGLPILAVPLPSRGERCVFTLKPITNTLEDFCKFIQDEDRGVDRVAAYNKDGDRIAQSTPIDVLLQREFNLVLNDQTYSVTPPEQVALSSERLKDASDVKTIVAQLYSTMNVEQHQLEQEKKLLSKLEELKLELAPYEKIKSEIATKAERRTVILKWLGLGMMGLQFGVLARLTWWEYSWDIMEPVTYFVTYGTTIAMYAYYVCTKQEYTFPAVRDREYLLSMHHHAKKRNLDINTYNKICNAISQTEYDLQRLRDPLQLNLPIQHLHPKIEDKTGENA